MYLKMLYNPDGMLQMKQRNLIGSSQDTAALKSILTRGFTAAWMVSWHHSKNINKPWRWGGVLEEKLKLLKHVSNSNL